MPGTLDLSAEKDAELSVPGRLVDRVFNRNTTFIVPQGCCIACFIGVSL